jgi:hypothetical protein
MTQSSPDFASLSLPAAQALLRLFTCLDRQPAQPMPGPTEIRAAVRQVREQSDYQIFGICADTPNQAIASLHAYLTALDYPDLPQPPTANLAPHTAVYLKYNPKTGLCYLSPYTGEHRGVLLSCQSAYEGDVNETFGHLPLGLWEGEG